MSLEQEIMPLRVNDSSAANQILQLFPEIKYHYGESVESELYVDLIAGSGDFLTLSQYTGMEIGKKDKARMQLQVKCKNSSIPQELAVAFDMDL